MGGNQPRKPSSQSRRRNTRGNQKSDADSESNLVPQPAGSSYLGEKPKPTESDQGANDKRQCWKKIFRPIWITAFATVVIMAATVVQAIVGAFQWRSMNDQVKLAQRQLDQAKIAQGQTDRMIEQTERDQRAWVGIERPAIDKLVPAEPIKYRIVAKNYGRTPATIIAFPHFVGPLSAVFTRDHVRTDDIRGRIDKCNEEVEAALANFAGRPAIQTVPPGADVDLILPHQHLNMSPETIAAMAIDKTIYAVGAIVYKDGVGGVKVTRFCYRYAPDPGVFGIDNSHDYNGME